MTTKIEWVARPGTTPETWNPVTGCTKVSEGCQNCYAERMAKRLAGRFGYPEAPHQFDATLHPDRLKKPLRWHKPRTVFIPSMGDLFHTNVPFSFVVDVFAVIHRTQQHTYLILTKRQRRMAEFVNWYIPSGKFANVFGNVWLGVTAENQTMADKRIPLLLQTPAAVRFVSCEPLLGPVDIGQHLSRYPVLPDTDPGYDGISWVIAGGESGPGARPVHPDWVRGLRDQCQAAGIPFFFKAWGAWLPNAVEYGCYQPNADYNRRHILVGGTYLPDVAMVRAGKKAAGRLLDGREWNEWPK